MIGRRWLSLSVTSFALAATAKPAVAQLAPTGGHYAARSSDTGHGGTASSSGGYSTSVPLDLPPARGGLPVPVAITHGGQQMGAAGRGWDIPLSYIQRDATLAHRRPVGTADVAPQPREQVSLVLDGQRVDLVKTATDWIARYDAPDIVVREQGDGSWVMFDGHGRTYRFTAMSSGLAGTSLWLLEDISGVGGSNVHLDYNIATVSLPGGSAITIDLAAVTYNPSPAVAGCYKNTVSFGYDANTTTPLSLGIVGNEVLARQHKLTQVDVLAKESCSTQNVRLRRYQLNYVSDPDTQQPRLQAVDVFGREGTPEASTPLPIARYSYGTATSGGQLDYQLATTHSVSNLGFTRAGPLESHQVGVGFHTQNMLVDLSGDGRPEFRQQAPDSFATARPIESRTTSTSRYTSAFKNDLAWRQVVDVNGDGRLDVIDAREQAGRWVVYLNTPHPDNPPSIVWERRSFSIAPIAQHLANRGFTADISPNFVPLSRRVTMKEKLTSLACYELIGPDFWDQVESGGRCHSFTQPLREKTITEWEVKDVNGDGYPDFVFNSSPVVLETKVFDETLLDPSPQWALVAEVLTPVLQAGSANKLEAVYNILGVRLTDGTAPAFSAPVTLRTGEPCGVARWESVTSTTQKLVCDIVDVNGDGIVDRVNGNNVFLGTGSPAGDSFFLSGAVLTLPGPLASQQNDQGATCSQGDPHITFRTIQTAGLRDLTGDGVPDYIRREATGSWRVAIGTGTGFLAVIPVSGDFELSSQIEDCAGIQSTTDRGLFDFDADGKADMVRTNGVLKLVGASGVPGNPDAGRMIQIDNGYDAKTIIHYRSIKEDPNTLHQVPFPEIVVDSVETAGTLGFGGNLAAVRYVYGGAELLFDPAVDAFLFPGYRRRITVPTPVAQPPGVATITITDTYAPTSAVNPYGVAMGSTISAAERYRLRTRIGQVSDVTVLSGDFGETMLATPSLLLGINIETDHRRIAFTHYDWGARLFASTSGPPGPEPCSELVFPYNHANSATFDAGHDAYDPCMARGFGFGSSMQSWRGEPGAARLSTAGVETRTDVGAIDELGRALTIAHLNDVHRTDDDLCTVISYAAPTGSNERQLHAVASQAVTNCGTGQAAVTYATGRWEYDHLPVGSVSAGLPTAYTVERRDDTGALLNTIRTFDATFDEAGNPVSVTSTREDGASRTVTTEFDLFRIAATRTTTTATGVPGMQSTIERHPLTLNVLSITDPQGAKHGVRLDGFDRLVMSTAAPVGGVEGAMAVTTYLGFAGGDSLGRRIEQKAFTDLINPSSASTASGRIARVFLDELGRERHTEVALGADYGGHLMIAGHRVYDGLGRVVFEANPYPSTQSIASAHGTTAFFHVDGTLRCSVRANGQRQSLVTATNESQEIYPTCVTRTYQDHTEVVSVEDAASLLAGSPQAGVKKTSYTTAIGRLLARTTSQGGSVLEYATFGHDRLGHQTSMTRYQDPAAAANPVTSSWRYDSLGQLLRLDEPTSAPQFNLYSNWGELVSAVRFQGEPPAGFLSGGIPTQSAAGSTAGLRVNRIYDALGRVIRSEERNNGVTDPETVNDYFYDQGVDIAPQVTPANVLGRLALATSPTNSVSFSYDGLGRISARVFTDNQGEMYVEKHALHADGSPATLHLFLADTGYADEEVTYQYDSAGRGRSVQYLKHVAGATSEALYQATTIDAFGRVRQAQYGQAGYDASFADVGRRLIQQVMISSPLGSRTISYQGFDPAGRERSRQETKTDFVSNPTEIQGPPPPDGEIGSTVATAAFTYDPLGRLASTQENRQDGSTTTVSSHQFMYDALGNILGLSRTGAGAFSRTLTYLGADRDRICRIRHGTDAGTACNVTYDEVGSILTQATPTGQRQYNYLINGSVRTISDGQGSIAHYRYDAFGAPQALDITSTNSQYTRQDRHYGTLISRRNTAGGSVILRKIPGPNGFLATLPGPGGAWTFAFSEPRGNRFFTDAAGAFVQEIDYDSYGKATSTGAQPGSPLYSSEQWNGGDTLEVFGISQLGARLYDPQIGRFLRRDPLLIPRTAVTTNPYAFAENDPVNSSDPSGLDPRNDVHPPGSCPTDGTGGGTSSAAGPRQRGLGKFTAPSFLGGSLTILRDARSFLGDDSALGTLLQADIVILEGFDGSVNEFVDGPIAHFLALKDRLADAYENPLEFAQDLANPGQALFKQGFEVLHGNAVWIATTANDIASKINSGDGWGALRSISKAAGTIFIAVATSKAVGGVKPINLPAWRKVKVNMDHILERHVHGAKYEAGRTLFPSTMNEKGIMRAIREAYTSSTKMHVQSTERLLLRGRGRGLMIDMWFNKVTNTIESAYPVTP